LRATLKKSSVRWSIISSLCYALGIEQKKRRQAWPTHSKLSALGQPHEATLQFIPPAFKTVSLPHPSSSCAVQITSRFTRSTVFRSRKLRRTRTTSPRLRLSKSSEPPSKRRYSNVPWVRSATAARSRRRDKHARARLQAHARTPNEYIARLSTSQGWARRVSYHIFTPSWVDKKRPRSKENIHRLTPSSRC